ncbi:GTP-binding nuclear protein gsp1/Ran [Rhodotorula toruloides]
MLAISSRYGLSNQRLPDNAQLPAVQVDAALMQQGTKELEAAQAASLPEEDDSDHQVAARKAWKTTL